MSGIIFFEKQMNLIKIFLSSVQNEFAIEHRRIAGYIRQDALFSMYFEPFLFEELPAQDKKQKRIIRRTQKSYLMVI